MNIEKVILLDSEKTNLFLQQLYKEQLYKVHKDIFFSSHCMRLYVSWCVCGGGVSGFSSHYVGPRDRTARLGLSAFTHSTMLLAQFTSIKNTV